MVCIYCDSRTRVLNSRHQKRINRKWRRRECIICKAVFTSLESIDFGGSIAVSSTKHLQPFHRDKLFISIYNSLKHRKTALRDATELTDTIISKLYSYMKNAILDKESIIFVSLQTLKRFDKVAAIHYEAFHPLSSTQ